MPSKKKTIYCSLDLEGTGLDPKKDAIIEVGAVLFQIDANGEIEFLEEFSQLVKPSIPIPEFIQGLTGITEADVASAPAWEQVRSDFAKFVGDRVIVGQNIQFDLAFLLSTGLAFEQGSIDTKELASIFLPGARFFNLEYLMRFFDLPLLNHHRALQDSKSAALLLQQFIRHFHSLPGKLQKQVENILKSSNLVYRDLFVAKKSSAATRQVITLPKAPPVSSPVLNARQASLFESPKASGIVSSFDPKLWDKALDREGFVFADLGFPDFNADTVKFLVSRLQRFDGGVLASFASFEQFEAARRQADEKLWVFLDEPKNYLCEKRFELLMKHPKRSDALAQFLIKALIWRQFQPVGNLISLPLFGSDYIFRDLVCCNFSVCSRHDDEDICELKHKLDQLQSGSRIITRHAAWLEYVELKHENRLSRAVIWDVESLLEALFQNHASTFTLKSIRAIATSIYNPQDRTGLLIGLSAAAKHRLEVFLNALDLHFGLWSILLKRDLLVVSQRVADEELRATDAYAKIRAGAEDLIKQLDNLLPTLSSAASYDLETGRLVDSLSAFHKFLQAFFIRPVLQTIYWFDIFGERLKLKSQSRVSSIAKVGNFKTVVFAGPYCSNKVKAHYARLLDFSEYESQHLFTTRPGLDVFYPTDLPAKDTPGSHATAIELLKQLLACSVGRSVILFGSQKSLESAHKLVGEKQFKNRLLVQRYTGHHWKNFEKYAQDPNAVWFLTVNNFLKNIITLPDTKQLVLMRIPYDSPGVLELLYDPDDFFEQYILPKTAVRIGQILLKVFSRPEGSRLELSSPRKKLIFFDSRINLDYNASLRSALEEGFELTDSEFSFGEWKSIVGG